MNSPPLDDCGGCSTPEGISNRIESMSTLLVEGHRALSGFYMQAAVDMTNSEDDRKLFLKKANRHLEIALEVSDVVLPDLPVPT